MVKERKLKIQKLKSYRKLSYRIFIFGWVLWAVQTFLFMMLYGWHIEPINGYEKILDIITGTVMSAGLTCMVICMWTIDGMLLKALEDE